MLLVHCGVEFEDVRVEREQWADMKGSKYRKPMNMKIFLMQKGTQGYQI